MVIRQADSVFESACLYSPAVNGLSEFASAVIGAANPWQTFIDGLNSAVPGLGSIVDFISGNFVPILSGLAVIVLSVVIPALWTWIAVTAKAALVNIAAFWPVYLTVGLIAAAVGLLVAAWQNNWFGIRDATAAAWAYLQPILQQLWEWLSINIPIAIAAAVATFWTIVAGAQQAGTAISTWFGATLARDTNKNRPAELARRFALKGRTLLDAIFSGLFTVYTRSRAACAFAPSTTRSR